MRMASAGQTGCTWCWQVCCLVHRRPQCSAVHKSVCCLEVLAGFVQLNGTMMADRQQ